MASKTETKVLISDVDQVQDGAEHQTMSLGRLYWGGHRCRGGGPRDAHPPSEVNTLKMTNTQPGFGEQAQTFEIMFRFIPVSA